MKQDGLEKVKNKRLYQSYKEREFTKKDAIKAAKELCYGDDVVAKLHATDKFEDIQRIMVSARNQIKGRCNK